MGGLDMGCVGIDHDLHMAAVCPKRVDHFGCSFDGHDRVLVAVEDADWEPCQGFCLPWVSATADRGQCGEGGIASGRLGAKCRNRPCSGRSARSPMGRSDTARGPARLSRRVRWGIPASSAGSGVAGSGSVAIPPRMPVRSLARSRVAGRLVRRSRDRRRSLRHRGGRRSGASLRGRASRRGPRSGSPVRPPSWSPVGAFVPGSGGSVRRRRGGATDPR